MQNNIYFSLNTKWRKFISILRVSRSCDLRSRIRFTMVSLDYKSNAVLSKVYWGFLGGNKTGHQWIAITWCFLRSSLVHLETSSDLLFRTFFPWCVAISSFSFKLRLLLSIARLTGAHLCTFFQAISELLLADLRFHNSFESSLSFFLLVVVKWFFIIVKSLLKISSTTTLI